MFTHTKDVPFAAAMVWSLYFITVIARRMPELPAWRTVIGLGVAVGCAMGLRVGGVFAGLYLALTLLAGTALLGEWRRFPWLVLRLVPAGLIAFAIMAVTWPWSVLPPTNLLTAMGTFSNFAFDLSTLINGHEVPIDQVPATYMSEYLLIKLPEITLAGILAALAFAIAGLIGGTKGAGAKGAWHGIWRRRLVAHLPVALALIVPVVFTLLDRPPLYNGIRHFLFVIPAATVVAAIGLCALWRWSMRRSALLGLGFATVAGGLFALNAVNFVELHPYEYVGYNQLVGGLDGRHRPVRGRLLVGFAARGGAGPALRRRAQWQAAGQALRGRGLRRAVADLDLSRPELHGDGRVGRCRLPHHRHQYRLRQSGAGHDLPHHQPARRAASPWWSTCAPSTRMRT